MYEFITSFFNSRFCMVKELLLLILLAFFLLPMANAEGAEDPNAKEDYTTITYIHWTDMFDNSYSSTQAEIVMLGDSITHGVNWNELMDKNVIVNRGIGGDITKGFLNRMENIIEINPKKVFLMGGLNDINRNIPISKIYRNYINIIEKLKENHITPLIQSTLYTAKSKANTREVYLNKKIKILNEKLQNYAAEKNIEFIDLNKHLSENETLKNKYTLDGYHLNAQGYSLWRDELKGYME